MKNKTNKTKQNKHELQIYPLSLNLLHDDLIESFILSVSYLNYGNKIEEPREKKTSNPEKKMKVSLN